MSISMDSIPGNIRIPWVAVEFDNSRASQGPALLPYRALVIGQKIAAGTATADTLRKATNADEVAVFAGRGSQLHREAMAWFDNNQSTEVMFGVLSDNGAGVAATGTATFSGTATASGTLSLWVGDTLVSVPVTVGDTAATVATNTNLALTDNPNLPVTGGVASAVLTFTARNKGPAGNDTTLRLNYQDGETTPPGITVVFVAMASGATNPVLTNLIAAMGDVWFQVLVHPYTDAASLTALETEFASRNGPMRMIDGALITSAAGTVSTLGTLGLTRNSRHSVIVVQAGKNPPTPPAEFAAALGAVVAYYAPIDPARPLQTLPVVGVLPPLEADLFTAQERNLLLFDGISTTRVAAGGIVQVERLITTYRTNGAGAPDTSYLDLTTLFTNMYARFSFRAQLQTKYPRAKLADDGAQLGPGQVVMTPKLGKAEALIWFDRMEKLGLVENPSQFKRDLVVERDTVDPNRMNWLLPYDLVNSFIVGAVKNQFRL